MPRLVFSLSLVGVLALLGGCVDYPSPTQPIDTSSVASTDEGITADTDTFRYKCPSDTPSYGDTCYKTALKCSYENRTCSCEREVYARFWNCYQCPLTIPDAEFKNEDRSPCKVAYSTECRYENNTVSCAICGGATNDNDFLWECATCPTQMPDNDTDCKWRNQVCEYANDTCICIPGAPGFSPNGKWACQSSSN